MSSINQLFGDRWIRNPHILPKSKQTRSGITVNGDATLSVTSTNYETLVDITGGGVLYRVVSPTGAEAGVNGTCTIDIKITIDGIVYTFSDTLTWYSDDPASNQTLILGFPGVFTYSGTYNLFGGSSMSTLYGSYGNACLNMNATGIRFDKSLKIEFRLQRYVVGQMLYGSAIYSLDS